MNDYISLADEVAESTIYTRMRSLDETARLGYAEIGLMCVSVQNRLLWRTRIDPDTGFPCRSFSRWLRIAAPFSYSTAYSALRDVEELADIPASELAQIPQSNIFTMKQLSTAVRAEPAVLQAAKTQRSEDFVEHIRKTHPGQALEEKKTFRFNPPQSAAEVIERALKMAEGHGAANRNDALELMAVTCMEQWRLEAEVEDSLRAEDHRG